MAVAAELLRSTAYLPQSFLMGLGVDRVCWDTFTVFRPGLPTRSGRHLIRAIASHLLPEAGWPRVRPRLAERRATNASVEPEPPHGESPSKKSARRPRRCACRTDVTSGCPEPRSSALDIRVKKATVAVPSAGPEQLAQVGK